MKLVVRPLLASVLVLAAASCSHLPGGHGLPSMPSDHVDPNACGGYASTDIGGKLKAFLTATKDLDDATTSMAGELKTDCTTMGHSLQLADADLAGDAGAVCGKVFSTIQANLKVGLKAGAKLSIKFTPGHCELDVSAAASGGGSCSGAASAGTGGTGAEGQCQAYAKVEASVHATCTPPQLSIEASAGVVADKTKIDATVAAMKDGLPKILSISAKIAPVKEAFVYWASTAKDLAASAKDAAKAFGNEAICVSSQIALAAKASAHIEANVNVSVSVSASASGSVGG